MAYEIPQQLQHKEKILFGLTIGQIGWSALFSLIILIVFSGNYGLTAKFLISSPLIILWAGFCFFDFAKWISHIKHFFSFREAKLHQTSKMKKLVDIQYVDENTIHSHKQVSLLQVTPMNFTIKTEEEKEAITIGFQKFLNSLDHPIQIIVTIHNLNIESYLAKAKERSNDKELFTNFEEFMQKTIAENEMRNRHFFIVIPKSSNLEVQTTVVKQRLESMGLKTRRIYEQEIINNLRLFFNDVDDKRQTSEEQGKDKNKKELEELTPEAKAIIELVKKIKEKIKTLFNPLKLLIKPFSFLAKKINKNQYENQENYEEVTNYDKTQFLIAPNYVKDNIDSLQVNKRFFRILAASGYPRSVEQGFLDRIIGSNDDFDISIHIEPSSISSTMLLLNRELQKQRADLYAEEKKSSINPSLEIKYADTRKTLEELQKGTEKLFNVSLYINCKAKNETELNLLTKKVEAELNSLMIIPYSPKFQQIQAYKSILPIAKNELKLSRNITTKALSAFFPFTSPFLNVESEGVMLGLNKNKVPYIKDIFALSNANGIVLATSGSGKSYFTKLLISRQMLNNVQVIAIDPQSEYLGLAEKMKGQIITISQYSSTIINPLDLMNHTYTEKRLMLMDLFKVMFGELTEIQKSILDRALSETYKAKDITVDDYNNKEPPVLGDLYDKLSEMDEQAAPTEKITYRAILNRLYLYTEGVFSFLNRQTNINYENKFVTFNIGDMPKQVQPIIMFLILDFVYMKMKENKNQKKLLVIDEAWSLLGKAEEASYIFEIVKTCRKFNMGLLLITQDVADLVNSKAGSAVLANSAYTFLLRQKPAVINNVVKKFNLSTMEKEYLLSATQGRGILILDNEHQELEVVASPEEHAIITTNPNDVLTKIQEKEEETRKEKVKTQQKADKASQNENNSEASNDPTTEFGGDSSPENKAEIKALDLNKKLYTYADLTQTQQDYLVSKGYEVSERKKIGAKKPRILHGKKKQSRRSRTHIPSRKHQRGTPQKNKEYQGSYKWNCRYLIQKQKERKCSN
jgi:conjugal transfer ATP-binding protein TraC